MKKWLALFLALVMTLSLLPTAFAAEPEQKPEEKPELYVYTEADNARIENDVFASIDEVKLEAAQACGGIERMTEQDYIALIPQVIERIEASATYAPGTLQANGNFLVWETTVGIPCCYDPRMEAELHNTENDPSPAEIALAEARAEELYQELSELQGGWPSSTNIGLIQPYWESSSNYADSSFNSYSPSYKAAWEAFYNTTGGQGIRYCMNNANVNNIGATMSQCGLVMFDSHGSTDYSGSGGDYTSRANTSYLCLITNTGVTSQDTQAQTGQYGTYYHCLKGSGYAYVDGTCIGYHMTNDAPNSYLYMGICLGMATDGMEGGLRAKGVEAVWGYSQSVSFYGDELYMKALMTNIKNGDELQEAAAKVKAQYGSWDPAYPNYSYSQAVANYVAFPIVASDEDPYPGHGNVDVVQTVYSTWTLFEQFQITAVSNNSDWGTVSVSGRKITATPAVGYEIVGYEVLSGTASVTQNGHIFQVDAETDCTIQINFAARVPATVSFSVPEGVSCGNFAGYVGDHLTMPTPTGAPTADAHNYAFLGWALAEVPEDVTAVPTFVKAGTDLTVSVPEATYYALYSYFIADDGFTEGEFTLVTSPRANWAGDYVITYQGQKLLKATVPSGSIETSVADIAQTGAVVSGDTLSNVADDYIFTVEEANGGVYNIKMKEPDVWLALTKDSNSLMTAEQTGGDDTAWNLSCNADGMQIASAAYPNRTIRFNSRANAFRCYKSGQQQIAVYAAAEGTKYYTTQPKNRVECEVHSFGDWTTVNAPTCTESGLQKRVCTVCGFVETEELDPLGHDVVQHEAQAPTCTEIGWEAYETCSRCEYSTYTEIPALGHDYAAVVTEPNCTEGGYTTYTCTRCGDSFIADETEALGHDYAAVVTEPTCNEGGYTTYTCTRCGDTYADDETEPLGHDYAAVVTEPTCNEGGFTTYTCTRCGDTYTGDETEALGHDWDEGVVTTEPTYEAPGVKTYTCTRCGASREEEIPMLVHDCPCAAFEDMPEYGTPEHEAIDWAFTEGITAGMDDTHFGVGKTLTRAQAATFLYAAAGKPEFDVNAAKITFTDVPAGKWYTTAVLWAASEGLVAGYADGTFLPNNTLTRGQILVILYAKEGKPSIEGLENPYTDVAAGKWFTDSAIWAYHAGIEQGTDGVYAQSTPCTREAFVLYLYREMTGNCLLND